MCPLVIVVIVLLSSLTRSQSALLQLNTKALSIRGCDNIKINKMRLHRYRRFGHVGRANVRVQVEEGGAGLRSVYCVLPRPKGQKRNGWFKVKQPGSAPRWR
ncbi:hypothetical protein J6590_058885 [Homalodisca vitripennis]|nr:hypothetical protein J6590_058885 [Homalodisca vitripennis]